VGTAVLPQPEPAQVPNFTFFNYHFFVKKNFVIAHTSECTLCKTFFAPTAPSCHSFQKLFCVLHFYLENRFSLESKRSLFSLKISSFKLKDFAVTGFGLR
jgi:hypothetical protein